MDAETALRIAAEFDDPPAPDDLQLMFDRGYREGYIASLKTTLSVRDALIERLARIAGEQAELSAILDNLLIPTNQAGHPLTFHQRVAMLAGFYEAVAGMIEERGPPV